MDLMKNWIIVITSVFFLLSCGRQTEKVGSDGYYEQMNVEIVEEAASESEYYDESAFTEYDADVPETEQRQTEDVKIPDKIIWEASIIMEVTDYKKSLPEIRQMVKTNKGYISYEYESKTNYKVSNEITIRIPNERFDNILEGLDGMARKVDSKRVSAQDVSEEYVDIETRLKTKKEVEKRYIELLKKAHKIEDILAIEEKIRIIREEIEAKEGRLKYLNDRISFSTISLEVYQTLDYTYIPESTPGFGGRLLKALDSGWKGLLDFVLGLFYIWPYLIIVAGLIFLFRRYWKKRKLKKK